MKFLIVGDSWGCGEWDKDCTHNPHRGLEQYLSEDGHTVVNISNQGISNQDIYQRIETYFRRYPQHDIDLIFVFQTEYNRDYKHNHSWETHLGANDWDEIQQPQDLAMRWISRFYHNLSDISQKVDCPVYIIGGHSDALWLDTMDQHYPGCRIICQSMTSLILQNNHRVEQPVLSFYEQRTEELVQKIKSRLSDSDSIKKLIDLIDQGYQRESLLRENPQYFYPDGIHPNRQGHKILYDFIKEEHLHDL